MLESGEAYGFWDEHNNVFYEFTNREAFEEFVQWLNLSLDGSDCSNKAN